MAKKTGRARKPHTEGTRAVTTRDERDTTTTAAERRKQAEEKKAANRKPGSDPGDGEEVDVDQLPLNHQTIMDHRDVGLPPEATPREGKTTAAPPLSPAPKRGRTVDEETGEEEDLTERSRLVQATRLGYYDHARRRPGDVFMVHPDQFSDRWMRDVPKGTRERITTANQAIRQANADTRRLRSEAKVGGPFPSTPNARTGITGGLDQAVEDNPLED